VSLIYDTTPLNHKSQLWGVHERLIFPETVYVLCETESPGGAKASLTHQMAGSARHAE